jgi:hypothetical protein
MAAWAYNIIRVYGGTFGNSEGFTLQSGTLDDGQGADFDFTPSDTITIGEHAYLGPDIAGTYLGTVEVGGLTWVAVTDSDTTSFYALSPDPMGNETLYDDGFTALDTVEGNQNFINISLENTSSFTVCFAPGTLIATPSGETAVEALCIGDLVTTADGRAVPVRWIGQQTVHKVFAGERARPVRIAAGALGAGLPHTDLVLTADHALILDGLAINAGALVNGTTITLDPLSALPDRVTYYHVETEHHDIILANGTPAETFVDYVGRLSFDNHADYVALYGDERIIAEMPLPRISTARLVPPTLKARLGTRAVA